MYSKLASFVSDPTPVRWIESVYNASTGEWFQTPRLWGGFEAHGEVWAKDIFQTPRLWGGCVTVNNGRISKLSDPTPVGWIIPGRRNHAVRCFRPHACGVDQIPQ